jgi:arylformamidase
MRIIDISMDISHGMPVYKGRESKRPFLRVECDFSNATVYESRLDMNLHTGTHADAPLHMINGGSDITVTGLERFVRKCRVVDLTGVRDKISRSDLQSCSIKKDEFLLLKTRNSIDDILEGTFIYIDGEGAEYLKEAGISGVGIDALGIEREQPGHETHLALMEADIVILEGLRLGHVETGEYLLVAAPLKIQGGEASPVRALLIQGI